MGWGSWFLLVPGKKMGVSAVEEFCASDLSPQLPYQMEAALFCLSAISMDASKWALLVTASPVACFAEEKACSPRDSSTSEIDGEAIGHDAKCHDEQLARCVRALATAPDVASSNPMSLAQLGRFLGKYANWLSKTPSQGVLDAAASLSRLHRSIEQRQLSRTIQILLTKLFRHHLLTQQLLYVIF